MLYPRGSERAPSSGLPREQGLYREGEEGCEGHSQMLPKSAAPQALVLELGTS